jgi:hypothetical protein
VTVWRPRTLAREAIAAHHGGMEVALTLLTAWFGTGVAVATVMRRRGHDHSHWLRTGLVAGPFSVGLAVEALTRPGHEGPDGVERSGGTGCGRIGHRVPRFDRRHPVAVLRPYRPHHAIAHPEPRRRRRRHHRRRPHGLHGHGG